MNVNLSVRPTGVLEGGLRLPAVLASLTEAVLVTDGEGRITDFNNECVRYYRFKDRNECRQHVADWARSLDVWYPDGRPVPPDQWAIRRALSGESAANVEYRVTRKDGGEAWWGSYNFSPIRDEAGTIIGAVVAAREITELKEAEAALRESEQKYRTIFNAIDEGFCILEAKLDDAGDVVDLVLREINPAFGRLTGFSKNALGRRARELMPNLEGYWLGYCSEVVRTGIAIHRENYVRDIDRWVSVHFSRVGGLGGRLVAVLFSDITDRKRAEAALRERDERQAFLLTFSDALRVEIAPDAVADRALRLLSQEMGLDRCFLVSFRLAEGEADITREVGRAGLPPLPASYRTSDFPDSLLRAQQPRDRTLAVEDIAAAVSLGGQERQTMLAHGHRAFIASALRRGDENPLWAMVAASSEPRRWTPVEVALVEEAAERTWAAIERASAERAHRESERRLRALVEASSDAVFQLSPNMTEMFGLVGQGPVADAPASNRNWVQTYVDPADQPLVLAAIDEAIRTKRASDLQHRVTVADGSTRWVQSRAVPIVGASGEIAEWIGMTSDITRQRQAEQAIRDSEARLRELADSMPQLVWIATSEQKAAYYNARGAEYGVIADQDGAYQWMPMVHPDDLGATIEAWGAAVARGDEYEKEHRLLVAGRGYRWHLSRARPQRDETGAVIRWFGTATDIHDLTQAEASLRESEFRFRAIFENAAVSMTHTARDGRFLRVNDRFCALLGYSREELVARRFHDHTHPDDLDSDLAETGRILAGEISAFTLEKRFVRKDGTAVWCNLTVGSVRDAEGAFDSFVSVIEDISARRMAEAALRDSEALLKAVVDGSPDAIYLKDREGRMLLANPASHVLASRPGEPILGRTDEEIHADPEVSRAIMANDRRIMDSGQAEVVEEMADAPDGRHCFVSHKAPFRDAAGKIVGVIGVSHDVTDLKKAEAALRESEERASFLLKLSDALRPLGDAAAIEATAARYLGEALEADRVHFGPFDPEAGAFSIRSEYIRDGGPSHAGVYPHSDFPDLVRIMEAGEYFVVPNVQASDLFSARTKRHLADLGVAATLTALLFKAGRLAWRLTVASKTPRVWTKQEADLVREVRERCWDAVQRAHAEAALQESEERFRASFAHASIGFAMTAPDGRILDANRAQCAITGYSLEELRDLAFRELVHQEDLAANMALEAEMFAGRIPGYVLENRAVRKGGDSIWVRKSVSLVRGVDRAPRWIVALIEDITDRVDAEAALRESEERFRACFANASIGFAMAQPSGQLLDANPAFCAITGYSLEELRGFDFPHLYHPEDAAANMALIDRMLAGDIPDFVIENRYVRKGGDSIWVRKSVSLVRGAEGEPCWLLALVEDVTARVEAEAAVREADRRKDEFLATLAHELRNPLAPIRSGLEVLQRAGSDGLKAGKARDMMARQVDHLVRLVDDLLEVSRVSRGLIELRKERIDLAFVVDDAIDASRPLVAERGHRLTVSLPPAPLTLEADPTRLAQVLINLVNNAAKYTAPGGHIEISAREDDGAAVVTVRDNGVGIAADALPRVFDLFTRIATGSAQPGLGIGLALVRRLVEMHGGRIEARSEGVGRGSEFTVRLPLGKLSAAGAREQPRAEPSAAPARRILVVDDSRDVADSLAMLLESVGMEVSVAYDGTSALEAAAAFRPEIVFLDLGMPKIDGYETARRLRELPDGADVFVVALTGWGQGEVRRRTLSSGFDEHLTKPVDFGLLNDVLKRRR